MQPAETAAQLVQAAAADQRGSSGPEGEGEGSRVRGLLRSHRGWWGTCGAEAIPLHLQVVFRHAGGGGPGLCYGGRQSGHRHSGGL